MNLLDKYRPRRLAEIVGQPAQTRRLARLVENPRPSCWLLEGPPGVGKSASAHALAHELGCYEGFWETCHVTVAADLSVDLARQMLCGSAERVSPLRLRAPNGWHVWIVEELELVSAQCQRWLKDGLERRLANLNCIVVATSNGAGKLDRALLQRFEILSYGSGPSFAHACQDRLGEIWAAETGGAPLPAGWLGWGFSVGETGSLEFSMREALKAMQFTLEAREDGGAVGEGVAA